MLKRGQIIRVPKDADLVMLREMKKQGLGNVLGIRGGSEFMILQALVGQDGIEQGDYMAVRPGWTTFYLIPKATAEGWDLEVDPAQEDERRTLKALQAELDKARSDLEEARLTLAAEQGKPEGAPSEGWRWTGVVWFHPASCMVVEPVGRLWRLNPDVNDVRYARLGNLEPMLARAAMVFADTKLEQR